MVNSSTGSTIDWSLPEYYFVCCMCIFNAVLFVSIVAKARYRQEMSQNKFALLVLILIICRSLIEAFLMNGFIWNISNSSFGCSITGYSVHYISIFRVLATLFMILKVIEINFQPFPMLAYSDEFIFGLKIFLLVLFATGIIVKETVYYGQLTYRVYHLAPDNSISVCAPEYSQLAFRKLALLFGPLVLATHILICGLFIRQANQLYHELMSQFDPDKIDEALDKLQRIIRPTIHHSILVLTITLSLLCFNLLAKSVNINAISLDSVDNFIVGLCVVCMFPFGQSCFNIFCGCIERAMIGRWSVMTLSELTLKAEKFHSMSMNSGLSLNESENGMNLDQLSTEKLPTIHEQTEDLISERSTQTKLNSSNEDTYSVLQIPEWREIEISMEAERLQNLELQKIREKENQQKHSNRRDKGTKLQEAMVEMWM